jgi:predicted nucleic acid-binding protein
VSFVDTWAWVALASKRDQHHRQAKAQHKLLQRARSKYVTTNFVLSFRG